MADDARPFTVTPLPAGPARERRFTVAEFDAMAAAGLLPEPGQHELWDGRVMMAPPPDGPHMSAERKLTEALFLALHAADLLASFKLQPGGGLSIGDTNLRAPDLMVLRAPVAEDRRPMPAEVALLIEVAGSSLADDLGEKREKYAGIGVGEYWVIDVVSRRVHVFRTPVHGAYTSMTVLSAGEALAPLFAAGAISLAVADLF